MPELPPSMTQRKATSKQDPTWTTRGSSAGNEFRLTHSQYDLLVVHTYFDALMSVISMLTAHLVDSIHLFFLPINPVLLKMPYISEMSCSCLLLWRATNLRGSITLNCLSLSNKVKKAVSKVVLKITKASYMLLTVFHAIVALLIVSSISIAFSADLYVRSVVLQKAQVLWNIFIL